ncbi:putative membrane protein [Halobacteriovorax marinus SJ]|uniref:Membrane protein n=1 Tax=Halobacteriovorax marinus (strain ATCC BAA-682 / DSM 15412 / SJ) TaxID=862908 RepID=E1X4H0_HALMS|nr:hypothetical protein [Halobacteriovorax marinus]CBW25400.1 putative membrane protein [Halobacteriovorax marinus SJ]
MKFWIKIEAFLNSLIEQIMAAFGRLISKLTPSKIKKSINDGGLKYEETKNKAKQALNQQGTKALSSALNAKDKTLKTANQIQSKSIEVIVKAKEVDYKRLDYKKLFLGALLIFSPVIIKVKSWLLNLSPKFILGSTFALTAVTLSSITIYTQSQKISDKASAGAREPASQVENATAVSKRKGYYKLDEKRFSINHVIMPVYIGTDTNLKTLSIDLTFISSNKYIKSYFSNNRHLIKDRLNTTIQPLIPEFPLETEGKMIIKEKIKSELNLLIKDLNIKGEIKEVHINSILAG